MGDRFPSRNKEIRGIFPLSNERLRWLWLSNFPPSYFSSSGKRTELSNSKIMDWLTDLESTVSALGTWDGNQYIKDDDCAECVKDIIRFVSGALNVELERSCWVIHDFVWPLFQLRRDDDTHEIRRRLGRMKVESGQIFRHFRICTFWNSDLKVVESDLIPIVRTYSAKDFDLFDLVLRLLVNLTNPEILLFREELPEDKVTRNFYIQLQQNRQCAKKVKTIAWK